MESKDPSRDPVQVTDQSLVAQWARAQSDRVGKPLGAVQQNGRPHQLFVENELLVDANDGETMEYLRGRFGAEIIPATELPPAPEGIPPERERSVAEMPAVARVHFEGAEVSLDVLQAIAERRDSPLQVTSQAAAGTIALLNQAAADGHQLIPNLLGKTEALPIRASTEAWQPDGTNDAYQWPEYTGPSNVAKAWQLFDAYARVRSVSSSVFLAIFDAGFALDGTGRPVGPNPDVTNFIQWNLNDEAQRAGGANNEASKPWHGNTVLSVAAAPINNGRGAAGSAGVPSPFSGQPIIVPCLFKTFRSFSEILRGLQLCVAWGIDVINISFSIKYDAAIWADLDPGFPTTLWNRTFQFAADQGVVVFAGAGNDSADLPDAYVLPATRTPGVITVGALDTASGDRSAGFSNYGSSVAIWAPGTGIHVMPDPSPGNANGSQKDGTSVAAPLVAGIGALLKAINTGLKTGDIQAALRDSGRRGSPDPKVTVALDAYAALLRVMGGRLPDGTIEEPNNTPETARLLLPGPAGVLAPVGVTTLAVAGDQDWYRFKINDYSRLQLRLDYLPDLSAMSMKLVPDDPHSRATVEQELVAVPGQHRLTVGQLAPGEYRVLITGGGPNMYELSCRLTPAPLARDIFETNDTFEAASQFKMKKETGWFTPALRRVFYPGTYEATLHRAADIDFYHIEGVNALPLVLTTFKIVDSDRPLHVEVYREDRTLLEQQLNVRETAVRLPSPSCYIRVSSATANRYRFNLADKLDPEMIPGPFEEEDLSPIPDWWPDPPYVLDQWEKYLQVIITEELKEVGRLRLVGTPGLTLELLSEAGEVVAPGVQAANQADHAVEVDLTAVEPGTYVARVGRDLAPAARSDRALAGRLAHFNLGPGW